MGTGGSREAEFILQDDVPAGEYRLIADGIITAPVDVTFEILWRRPSRTPPDIILMTFQQHFEPRGGGNFDAIPYEVTGQGAAIDFEPGMSDELILRYTGMNSVSPMGYVPNGDGDEANGRIPNLSLPL